MGTENIETSEAAGSSTSRRRFLGATGVGAAGVWAAPALISAASGAAIASQHPPDPTCTVYGQNLITNGGFETSDLTGWTTISRAEDNVTLATDASWAASSAAVGVHSGDPAPAGTEGTFRAVADQNEFASSILFQDILIPADACSARLQMDVAWDNSNQTCPITPSTDLKVQNIFKNSDPQSFRIDVMDPLAANPFSTQPADVLVEAFRTLPGDPDVGSASLDVDLSAYVGQVVRIRAGIVVSCDTFLAMVDNVRLDV